MPDDTARMNDRLHPTANRPVLALGFRPFFLLAGLFAVAAMLLWALVLAGHGPALGPLWHGHEMLFGYAGAVIAGFALTAAANWTGRATLAGAPLALIALVWAAARIAVALPGAPDGLKAVLCAGFFVFLAAGIGRPIVAAGNRRNYGIIGVMAVFAALELVYWLVPSLRARVLESALMFILLLVALIGGRIIPAFTRNATPGLQVRRGGQWRDWIALASLAVFGILVLCPATSLPVLGVVAAFGALAHALRMWGWGGRTTLRRPILWVLQAAYGCLPLGLALLAAQDFGVPLPRWVPLHVLAVGALGLMTLGMMTRVSLGHTGRAIVAGKATVLAYGLLAASVVVRAAGPFLGTSHWRASMIAAALLWTLAFVMFLAVYAPILFAPRPDGKPG